MLVIKSTCCFTSVVVTPDRWSPAPPWSQMAWGCRSSLPPQTWSDLREMRWHPVWSCLGWPPWCRIPCCTCSWVSSPWCAALKREALETSGVDLLNLGGARKSNYRRYAKSLFKLCCHHHTVYIYWCFNVLQPNTTEVVTVFIDSYHVNAKPIRRALSVTGISMADEIFT